MSTPSLQEHRIVIIGGGIIGCTSAYYLTHHPRFLTSNTHITLLEASTIAAGASGKAGGLVADWAYPRELTEISFKEHRRLAELHGGDERWSWREVACGHWEGRTRSPTATEGNSLGGGGLHGRIKAGGVGQLPEDLDWIDEGLTDAYESMARPGETAQVHPYEFTTSMLALSREVAGERLEVIEGAQVRAIERGNVPGAGDKVMGVTYAAAGSHAVHIPADSVLLAAGPWSPTLLPSLPITSTRAHSIVIEPASLLSAHVLFTAIRSPGSTEASTPEIYARPHNRVYACGPGDDTPLPELASQVQISSSSISSLRSLVESISTPLRDGKVEVEQACYLPLGGPIVGEINGVGGLVVATGHTCWGICNAPGTAKAVAELIMDGRLGKGWKLGKLEPRRFLNG
ncbi:FAD dependent oxidoreductase [Ramaria rubella]|nr:FAD dependent oxidoreductase [Ramaria rubella]